MGQVISFTYEDYLKNKYEYQELGHRFLLERKHACLYYAPGKAKTYPTIDAIRDVDSVMNGDARVLVLSTADAVNNMWNAEIAPQNILPKNTVIMSFTKAIQEKTKLQLLKAKWNILVIDECHKIKSHNAKISKLVFQLSKNTEYCFGLSGTPRANSDLDIFCQFHNMNIGEWGKVSYTKFVETFCDIEQMRMNGVMFRKVIGINHRYRAGFDCSVAMYTQRVQYSDEDNMPELDVKQVILPYVKTPPYKKAEQGVIKLSDYETTLNKLSAITKLHQIVNGYIYITDGEEQKTHHFERNKKCDWLMENVQKGDTIVYRFIEDLNQISSVMKACRLKYTENVEDYKAGLADVLILQCSRCEAFNLQQCNRMIFYTMDYSYIKYDQMLHRIWRMGQKNTVKVLVLTFDNSIEMKIFDAVQNKKRFADLFMSVKGDIKNG